VLRTVYLVLSAAFWSVVLGTAVMAIALVTPRAAVIDVIIRFWAGRLLAAAGVVLRVENAEVIRPDQRYIIIGNHSSYLDIPALQAAIRQPLRFLAKKSLFAIPVFGWAIKAAGFVPIDRKDRSTAGRSFELAALQLRTGRTVAVFPEEGRSQTREMKPFKRGAFLLALKAGLPIVPVAIRGMYDVLPAVRPIVHPGPVTIVFGEPIDVTQFSVRQRDELAELTRSRIVQMLDAPGDSAPPAQ
jgi:1-acyl-sn-glycerol-3-phosphate acyltransferase